MVTILDSLHREKTSSADARPSDNKPLEHEKRDTLTDKLRKTLQDEVRFEAFIDWMYREFSSEVMLSVIELGQFKQYLKEYVQRDSNPFDLPADRVKTIRFYDSMPRSSIVFKAHTLTFGDIETLRSISPGVEDQANTSPDTDSPDSPSAASGQVLVTSTPDEEHEQMAQIAGALYERYIRRHCELEINISFGLRSRWDMLHCHEYPEEDLIRLITLVDEILAEMLRFVQQSYLRFDNNRKAAK